MSSRMKMMMEQTWEFVSSFFCVSSSRKSIPIIQKISFGPFNVFDFFVTVVVVAVVVVVVAVVVVVVVVVVAVVVAVVVVVVVAVVVVVSCTIDNTCLKLKSIIRSSSFTSARRLTTSRATTMAPILKNLSSLNRWCSRWAIIMTWRWSAWWWFCYCVCIWTSLPNHHLCQLNKYTQCGIKNKF